MYRAITFSPSRISGNIDVYKMVTSDLLINRSLTETIGFGDSDYNDTTGGLGGVGQGYSYPMLKTWTIGLNVTF